MKLTIGFSPCPNDTFIFDAMVNGEIDTHGIEFDYVLEDVETLNRWAVEGKLDITKLSYNTFLHLVEKYALLHICSALGNGVGPLLISKTPIDITDINSKSIAIPGLNTTANLLLSLSFPDAINKHELVFSEIENAVLSGQFDAGLIIHESRFTYAQKGLQKIIDLGDWWENTMNAPIPLGVIVMKRKFDADLCAKVDDIIRQSLAYSWKHYPALSNFVTQHSQEMEEKVMRQHIELYVNDYTTKLGTNGEAAVKKMFAYAQQAKLINSVPSNIFY